jgi:salicylate hydroxylase
VAQHRGLCEGPRPGDIANWDIAPADLPARAGGLPAALRDAAGHWERWSEAVPHWRLWVLCGRAPVSGADALVQGRVALLGDAAHPMLPYLAQGAGMAIEDAAELASSLAMSDMELPLRLRRYALNRWQRVARVQRRSLRNGRIFHASGPLRWRATCRCVCWARACWTCRGCTGMARLRCYQISSG